MKLIRSFKFMFVMGIMLISILLLPVAIAACALLNGAITIRKSQGGTFQQIVLQYDKRQDQRLVYVGMSRVTSLDGLYMTNATNDFTFYHGSGSVAQGVREVRDELQDYEVDIKL